MLLSFFEIIIAITQTMLLPLLCGYIISRLGWIDSLLLTRIFTFGMIPVFVFLFAIRLEMQQEYIFLPLVIFVINALAAIFAYKIAQLKFNDKTPNLIGLSVGTCNTAHFGMPAVAFLLGSEWVAVFLLFVVGSIFNMNSVAYYLGLRGEYNMKQALLRMLKLPIIYGLLAGFTLDYYFDMQGILYAHSGVAFGLDLFEKIFFFTGIFIIGYALNEFKAADLKGSWIYWALGLKFSCLPLFIALFIALDIYILGLYSAHIYSLMILYAFLPIARNATAYAMMMGLYPGRAVAFMLVSIAVSLAILPFLGLLLPL